jgi:hypothetical protein
MSTSAVTIEVNAAPVTAPVAEAPVAPAPAKTPEKPINPLKKWFMDIVTEPNGTAHCPVRWFALLSTTQGLAMAAWAVFYMKQEYDMVHFFTAVGIALTTLGVALGIKKDSP